MRYIVGLTLGSWALAVSAQVPSLQPGAPIEGMQGAQIPSLGEALELRRQAAEITTLFTEIERLKRLGRFEEAQALDRRRHELMSSGPLGRMIEQGMGREIQRQQLQRPSGSPQIRYIDNVGQIGQFSAHALLQLRSRFENDAVFQGEPLFVRPVMTAPLVEMGGISAQIPIAAVNLMMEGYARMEAKDYDASEQSFAKAISLSRSPTFVQAMAKLDVLRGRGDVALRRLQSEVDALEKENPRSSMIAPMLWRQASIHNAAGAHDRAAEVCERALAAIIAAGGAGTAEYAAGQNNLGVALQLGGSTARAIPYYERSYSALQALRRNAPHQAIQYQVQFPIVAANLGLAFWQLGELARATNSFRVALKERTLYEGASGTALTERARLAKAQAIAVELHALMTLERLASGQGLGLQVLLERKGVLLEQRTRTQASFRRDAQLQIEPPQSGLPRVLGSLTESPVTREQAIRERIDEQTNNRRAQDQDLLREYETVVQERAATPRTPANAARIADLETRIQVMQLNMEKHGQLARTEPSGKERASLFARVQASVPKDAVLLEMVRYRPLDPRPGLADEKRWGAARYGTYLIRPGSEAQYVDLGEAAPLDKLIAEFRAALANPTSASARDLGRKLDEAVMRPVRTQLGNALTMFVAPEGALNLIPLGALVDENGAYLLERYTINYLASGRDLLYLGRDNSARGPAIIFADPAFDEQAGDTPQPANGPVSRSVDFRSVKFGRLPGTADEARALKGILPDAAVLTGAAATETAAKKLAGPRILHIATHGFFLEDLSGDNEDPMLRSGLVFAGVNALTSGSDDGVLTALEASNLDLRGTKLVVLSACETGLGEVKNGEGVFGLRRAFVVAGAETLLMSLWQVSDESTKDLMTSYYTLLSRGETRAESLRQTQIAMLKNPTTAHPFFWAAFISSGETGNLK